MPPTAHHRLTERDALARHLLSGRNVLMLAPRRIGKTWLMKELERDLEWKGHTCIRIEVSGMRTEEVFLRTLCEAIERKQEITESVTTFFRTRLRQILVGASGDSLTQILTRTDPRVFSETLIGALDRQEQRTLILIDEFPLFVWEHARHDPDGARTFLYHLRRLQQAFPNVSWFLTGSIGLDVIARRFTLEGALLDFDVVPLEAFTEAEARSFLDELGDRHTLSRPLNFAAGAFEHLVRELGWLSPYYLDHLARHIRPTADGGATVGADDVDRAFAAVLRPAYRVHFSPWQEHIDKNFDTDDRARLYAILELCSEHPDGEQEDTLRARLATSYPGLTRRALKDLLLTQECDGLLAQTDGRWRFRSGLLRRYWREYVA
ncbi:AAA family ATPase [Azospirillum halopraeferens]|uniref:AAA family ATPase n=1 Tax=Azospirillum halopraeferens TaxID=34010 RepID=UPI00040BCF36|nr:AAA family ATPase [Azospirillum halopraeferens]